MKEYLLFAGVNGAGKSTLYQTMDIHLSGMPRVNTDEIVKTFGDWRNFRDVLNAGKIAVKQIEDYFEKGISFNQETTLCGASVLRNIQKAKELGYCINLHYVGVETVDIAKERIAQRVLKGGHGIPDKDVERRYTESFQKLKEVIPFCDNAVLYDNTSSFVRIAVYQNGSLIWGKDQLPIWYQKLV